MSTSLINMIAELDWDFGRTLRQRAVQNGSYRSAEDKGYYAYSQPNPDQESMHEFFSAVCACRTSSCPLHPIPCTWKRQAARSVIGSIFRQPRPFPASADKERHRRSRTRSNLRYGALRSLHSPCNRIDTSKHRLASSLSSAFHNSGK